MSTQTSYFQDAIETVEKLPVDDQTLLIEIIRQRLLEQRRSEIEQNAQDTIRSVREGRARFGSVEDLRGDLSGER
ncbi:MAG: hypothetical protein Q8L64_02315 [bacterium]|nr:hypothetical protein [bacterium]